jgi:hypothetical protein
MDLFGNDSTNETKEQKYSDYIRSAKWRLKRRQAIEAAGGVCQHCGNSRWSGLDVHHVTYDRFGNERPEDLLVLCKVCHKTYDELRQHESLRSIIIKRINIDGNKWWAKRFADWADAQYGENWFFEPGYDKTMDSFVLTLQLDVVTK